MILASIDDPELEARLAALPPDGVTVFSLGGEEARARGAIVHGTRMVNAMRANHGLGPLETLVLGEAYLLGGLLSATIKGADRLAFRFDGEGPASGLSVEAGADGSVRGYLRASPFPLARPPEGRAELWRELFGSGFLTMTRFSGGRPLPFTGTVASGGRGLALDLAAYYRESEQTRTAFAAGIEFDSSGRAIGAGALYVQALPGAAEAFLDEAEAAVAGLPPLGRCFADGKTRESFLAEFLAPLGPARLGEKEVRFGCGCSREGFAAFLGSGERSILAELAASGPWPAELRCRDCGTVYRFAEGELKALLAAPAG